MSANDDFKIPQETTGLLEEHRDNLSVSSGNRPSHSRSRSLVAIPTGKRKKGAHHRRRSSISQLFESFSGSLDIIREGVEEEGKLLQEAWKKQMRESKQGDLYFLDMGMTQSLSVIPDEFNELVEDAVDLHIVEAPKEANMAYRGLALLGAVFAVSSNGTALAMLHGVPPALKLYWRMTATAAVLAYFALHSMAKERPNITIAHIPTFFAAVLCFTMNGILFYTSLNMTSIGNAVIGANSQALLLILGKFFTGETVLLMELVGVLVAFTGCIFCAQDEAREASSSEDEDAGRAMIGNLLAFASAGFGVGYLTCARAVRQHIHVVPFMFMVMFTGSFLVLFYLLGTGHEITFSNDPVTGLFGWASPEENHIYVILYVAVICNVFGIMGFVRAMAYFSNVIIAVATLLEPMTATLIAYSLRVGNLPGALGWAGNLFVVLGTLLVVYPSMDKPMDH